MKLFIIGAILTISSGANASTDYIAQQFYADAVDIDPAQTVKVMTDNELASQESKLSKLIRDIEQLNDCPHSCSVFISPKTPSMVYSGKSGIQYHGQTYIVPIWVSNKGSGLIEFVAGHLIVSFAVDLDKGTTVTIEKFSKLDL